MINLTEPCVYVRSVERSLSLYVAKAITNERNARSIIRRFAIFAKKAVQACCP